MLALHGSGSRSAWRCLGRAGEEGCAVPPAATAAAWTVLFYLSALTLPPQGLRLRFPPPVNIM